MTTDPFAAYRVNSQNPQMQEQEDPFAAFRPQREPEQQPQESLGSNIGRQIGRTGARVAETVLGAPRAFGEFFESIVPEKLITKGAEKIGLKEPVERGFEFAKKYAPYKLFPKSEDIKELNQFLFGKKIEPKNEWEKKSDELVSDFTALALPLPGSQFKLLKPALLALGGNVASGIVGQMGGTEKEKGFAKLGTIFLGSMINPKSAEKLKDSLYSKAREAKPSNAEVTANNLVKRSNNFEKQLLKGDPKAKSKSKSLQLLKDIKDKISKNNKPSVFHGTQHEFEEFGITNDLGYHFSKSPKTAKIFATEGESAGRNGRIIEANLDIKNPIKMPDMAGWYPTRVAEWIDNQGLTKFKRAGTELGELEGKVLNILEKYPAGSDKGEKQAGKFIKEFLSTLGHDSIEYINQFEGNPIQSYIVFDPKKINQKSITPIVAGKEGTKKNISKPSISIDELEEFKRNINEARSSLYEEFKGDKLGRKTAKRNLDSVSKIVDDTLFEYGKKNPEWESFYRPANEVHGAIAQSKRVRNFIGSKAKQLGFPALLAELGLLHYGGPSAALSGITAVGAGASALLGSEIAARFLKSPTLRKHYINVVNSALKEDAIALRENLKKIHSELEEEEKD